MTKRQPTRPVRLHDALSSCQKEEEVKAEFCKFFKMKLCALGRIDHSTEGVLFETWDAGFCQVRNALKGVGDAELEALKAAHAALRAKLLPQVYAMEFLNPDVEYFT